MIEDRGRHLEFVQAAIGRMAGNSFLLKGWTITLAAALFALAAEDANPTFIVVALLPALSFWGLDAYYLRQERLYRKLYDDLRKVSSDPTSKPDPFSLSTKNYEDQVESWFRTLWSTTVAAIHGMIVAAIIITVVVVLCLH